MYDNIKNKVTLITSLASFKTGTARACLLYVKSISIKQAVIFTTLLLLILGTIPFITPTPVHAMLPYPVTEADCTKDKGTWTYVTGGGASPFVCNIATVKLMTPQEEASSYSYYSGLKRCVANTDGFAGPGMTTPIKSNASQDGNVGPSSWFNNDGSSNVIIYPYAQVSCADAMSKALSLWGYGSDYKGFLIAIGYQYNTGLAQWSGPSDGNVRWNQFSAAVQSKVYGGTAPSLSSAAMYANSIDGFLSSRCRATDLGKYNDITNTTYRDYIDSKHSELASNDSVKTIIPDAQGYINFAKVTIVNPDGSPEERGYAYQSNGGGALGCDALPAVITSNVPGWIAWMAEHPDRTDVHPPAIKDGTVNGNPDAPTCTVEGVGWIVCPVMRLMANVVDAAYGFVSSLLVVQPLMTTGSDQGVYGAWSAMRSFANVAFVIAFIIIIYSQLTGAGINNYGIKKMLPRLIVAAILVNVSYWVCAIAIDLSNIIGSSVNGLLHSAIPVEGSGNNNVIGDAATGSGAKGWVGITGAVLVATGVVLYIGLSALLPAVIAAALAIVTVFLVLTLRQALIILLVIISPLAFVAYLLPNTESLFKKWRQLFQTLLLMFPIIAFIFGASALASTIVMNGAPVKGDYRIAIQIMGALIAIIPLALTPIVMKTAGSLLGKFGGMVNNPNRGPFDRMKKGADNVRKRQEGRRAIRALNGGAVFGGGRFRREAKRNAITKGIESEVARSEAGYVATQARGVDAFANQLAGGRRFGPGRNATGEATQQAVANAINVQTKLQADQVTAAKAIIQTLNLSPAERKKLEQGGEATDSSGKKYSGGSMQKAALSNAINEGRIDDIDDAATVVSGDAAKFLANEISSNYSSVKSAGAHLVDQNNLQTLASGRTLKDFDLDKASAAAMVGMSADLMSTQKKPSLDRIKKVKDNINTSTVVYDSTKDADSLANTRKIAKQVQKNAQKFNNLGVDRQAIVVDLQT